MEIDNILSKMYVPFFLGSDGSAEGARVLRNVILLGFPL